MTSLTLPLRSESARIRPTRRARLLRLELHHSTMIWVLPLLGALFYFDPFRKASGYPPFWFVRSSVILHELVRISRCSRRASPPGPDRGRDGAKQSTLSPLRPGRAGPPRWPRLPPPPSGPWCRSSAASPCSTDSRRPQASWVGRLGGRWLLERRCCAPSARWGLPPACCCPVGSLPAGGACDIPGAHSCVSGSSSTSRTPPSRSSHR